MPSWEEWWEGRAPGNTKTAKEFSHWAFWQAADWANIGMRATAKHSKDTAKWALAAWLKKRTEMRKAAEERELQRQTDAKARYEASPAGRRDAALEKWSAAVEALREDMCKVPPAKMLATIKIYEWEDELVPHQGAITGIWTTFHYIDLFLVPSEEERAIIRNFKLDQLVLDDKPRYSNEELARRERIEKRVVADIARKANGADVSLLRDDIPERMANFRAERIQTRLAEYFDFPHSRGFETPHEAHMYAVKLREEILPNIRSLIEDYKTRSNEETFTV